MRTGKVSENVLVRSVLRQINKRRDEVISGAGIGEDCAVFSFSNEYNIVSCMREASAVTGEEADWIGRLLIKCANNLATAGAEPVAFELTLLLPQETEEPKIRELMRQAENACEALGAQIAGGQTRVTGAVTVPTAVVTGYAKAPKGADHGAHAAAPGQDVVISKWIGLEGTASLARQYREQLLKRYPAYLVDEAADFGRYLSLQKEAAVAAESGVCAMHDASEGGIFGALWELAEGAGVGLDIDLKKLPLRQETVEVCELCGVNPYELLSGGCLVMTSFDGPGLAAALEAEQIPAAVVGKVTKGPGRILRNDGEERFMDRPKQDALYGAGADMEDINKTDERQDHQV